MAWGTPDRMLSVGNNSRHATWHHPHTGSVTQYRRLQALTMENCANCIGKTMKTIALRSCGLPIGFFW